MMMLHDFCGLDFGTSNSTIGVFNKHNNISMVPLEQGKPILRSAIFFDYERGGCLFGQQGVNEYLLGTHGRLMVSLKSILGSSLMQEKTLIHNSLVSYTDILGTLIRYIKLQAEKKLGYELSKVVLGRPVRFHDYDDKRDLLAENTLREVALKQGFKTVLFQFEPIAAALTYEQTITKEQLALIVDLGGGTSDFSVIRLRPDVGGKDRFEDVLANKGIHIGGTDFDRKFNLQSVMPELGLGGEMRGISGNIQIPSSYYHDLTTWHTINSLYTHQTQRALKSIWNVAEQKNRIERLMNVIKRQQGHKILNEIEQGKCLLSQAEQISLDLTFIENNFMLNVERARFQEIIHDKVEQLVETLLDTVKEAGVSNEVIDSIFFTGGSTQIPMIRQAVAKHFPTAAIIQGDVFSSVGRGLIIDAIRKFS